MRDDVLIRFIEEKCNTLKKSGLWLAEPRMRPGAWLRNFDECDKRVAALLLDRFVFCNGLSTDYFLKSAWNSIGDGFPKGPDAPDVKTLLESLKNVVFTPVEGETPSPTDSGNLFCRKARQVLNIPDELFLVPADALSEVKRGKNVVFIDDFVGSGDQFVKTWHRKYIGECSFASCLANERDFVAIYITLVATQKGKERVNVEIPKVALCPTHLVNNNLTLNGLFHAGVLDRHAVTSFLIKYSKRLTPKEPYMYTPGYLAFGYKQIGLLLGFEHSIPDATLPIFWSPGTNGWEPLIERT